MRGQKIPAEIDLLAKRRKGGKGIRTGGEKTIVNVPRASGQSGSKKKKMSLGKGWGRQGEVTERGRSKR